MQLPLVVLQITVAFAVLCHYQSTPLNKLAVAEAVWARMPVDPYRNEELQKYKEWVVYIEYETNHTLWTKTNVCIANFCRNISRSSSAH